MKNRIREIRTDFGISQETLGEILNVSQQTISKIEVNSCAIYSELLIKTAEFFNVTTDYILGLSETKRNPRCRLRMSQELDQYYDIVLRFQNLSDMNQRILRYKFKHLEQSQL